MRTLLALAITAAAFVVSADAFPRTTWTCEGGPPDFCLFLIRNMEAASLNHAAPGMACAAATAPTFPPPPSGDSAATEQRRHRPSHHGRRRQQAAADAATFVGSVGRYTYEAWEAETTNATLFDMASCSKIMATTTATAQLYQRGYLGLDTLVADPSLLGPEFAAHGKGDITVRNLMLHNAGFPPDPNPGYSSPIFPCKENAKWFPQQTFDCDDTIYANLLHNQTLVYPTGSKFIYSDLSMITAMFVIGTVVRNHRLVPADQFPKVCYGMTESLVCNFYAYVWVNVFQRYGLTQTRYVPSDSVNRCAPQWRDPWYHHGLIMGFVSDQNAYALGGISGHAGVFSTVDDALKFMRVWMGAEDPEYLNRTTIQLFTTVANLTQSSRALGWDTNENPKRWCGSMSNRTFFHIGYTGTQFCGDPENGLISVLLANGRYPDYHHDGTIWYRPQYNSLVVDQLAKKHP